MMTTVLMTPLVQAYKEQDVSINELDFVDKASATKCVFHIGTDFYDFTPFKIVLPNPTAPFFDREKLLHDKYEVKYWFEFGWCQHLNDIEGQTYCKQDFFAGRLDASPKPTPNSVC